MSDHANDVENSAAPDQVVKPDQPARIPGIGEWVPAADLVPWDRNPKAHPVENVAGIARSIKRFGFAAPIVAWKSKRQIVAGHGRLLAAQLLYREDPGQLLATDQPGPGLVPVRFMEFANDGEAAALAIADNRFTEANPMDDGVVADLLRELQEGGTSIEGLGYDDALLNDLLDRASSDASGEGKPEGEPVYTNKIKIPIYEPKGDKPPISALFDDTKTKQLRAEIDAATNLPPDVAAFLRLAADRHTSFHFRNIAEFYCHADPTVQDLMERSGMVIIDYDKAVEYGFVKMTKKLAELTGVSHDA